MLPQIQSGRRQHLTVIGILTRPQVVFHARGVAPVGCARQAHALSLDQLPSRTALPDGRETGVACAGCQFRTGAATAPRAFHAFLSMLNSPRLVKLVEPTIASRVFEV